MKVSRRLLFTLVAMLLPASATLAQDVPIGGFIPLVGFGLTDEFDDGSSLSGTYFIASREPSLVGIPLSGGGTPYYDVALLDTGAATHILTPKANGSTGFDISGNGFHGTNTQLIGGATGLIDLSINNPLAIFAAGLKSRTGSGASLTMNSATMKGQSSVATLSAPTGWSLPNILGLPMAAQYSINIKNSEPQIFQLGGRTVRTPQIEFTDHGLGGGNLLRRAPLKLKPGPSFIAGPLYIQSFDIGTIFDDPYKNPQSPTVVENAGLFMDVDLANGTKSLEDKEFLFDTGADLTVVSEITAARLGFDPILDTPDFVLEVEGSGGVSSGIPGFYVETLNIDTVGGTFTLHNVPVAVLDVTNPNDPGNVIDGIVGMHLFTGRDLVIDTTPSIGQGGAGPSLYISDPVTQFHSWAASATTANFNTAGNWSSPGTPGIMWDVDLRNTAFAAQTAQVSANTMVFKLVVAGDANSTMKLDLASESTFTTFGEARIDQGGEITVAGRLDAQFVNIDGGTLSGNGTVFVGAGPVHGAVRNISGRVEPGDGVGTLEIDGDFSNLTDGTLAIELGGTAAGQYDLLSLDRFAFLAGTLEVSLTGGFTPQVGNEWTFLETNEDVIGEFENLLAPAGFVWDVEYLADAVVLKVLGLGTAGDFDGNGIVDGSDFLVWQRNSSVGNLADWKANFGAAIDANAAAVPEPAGMTLVLVGLVTAFSKRR